MVSTSYIKFLENSKNILNESAKDDSRIRDIIKKANNDKSKEETLAKTMAKLITTADKAKNRYEAALKILGKDHNVTKIFANRAKELNPDMDIEVEEIQPTKSPEKTVVFDKMTERANNSWITRALFSKINKFTKDYKVRDFFVGKSAKTREGRNIMSRSGLKWVEPMYIDFNINGKEYTICLDVVSDEGGRPSKYIIVPYESNKCFYQNHSIYDVYNSKEIAEIIINTLKDKANINEKQEDSNSIVNESKQDSLISKIERLLYKKIGDKFEVIKTPGGWKKIYKTEDGGYLELEYNYGNIILTKAFGKYNNRNDSWSGGFTSEFIDNENEIDQIVNELISWDSMY